MFMYLSTFCLYLCAEMKQRLCWLKYKSKMQNSTEHLSQISLSITDTVHKCVCDCMCVCLCVGARVVDWLEPRGSPGTDRVTHLFLMKNNALHWTQTKALPSHTPMHFAHTQSHTYKHIFSCFVAHIEILSIYVKIQNTGFKQVLILAAAGYHECKNEIL